MSLNALAGKPAPEYALVNVNDLLNAYYSKQPDSNNPDQLIAFGTSGHRGKAVNASFNEAHILAITQAVCEYRKSAGITGPLFLGMDTHALSLPAHKTAVEVLAANNVHTCIAKDNEFTPTPVISFSILEFNARNKQTLADGIVITPSHNPPEDGGFKYNPPHGGPADTDITTQIEKRANEILKTGLTAVKRLPYAQAMQAECIQQFDFITPYVVALPQVIDMEAIEKSGLKLCADALGGSSGPVWHAIAQKYKIDLQVVNAVNDPQFSFMTLDKDGKIRMDCSSPWAMASLLANKDKFDLCFANDPDSDRHGIVTPLGLMNPNHYLAAAVSYLYANRPEWDTKAGIGKTVVTSAMVDKVAKDLSRAVYEVPVGFKWFVTPLLKGTCAFGGEESAGASFLRFNGKAWSTDKDGIILCLLAAEITAKTGKTPAQIYAELTKKHGVAYYERIDAVANKAQKEVLKKLNTADIQATELAGDPITGIFTNAFGNNAAIGGLKVCTSNGWFAARPSGTEDIYKIYAESFVSPAHLKLLQDEAQKLVTSTFARAGLV
ncbi:phosphoglucomutase (alpha-D-glucose-1,6-bisphosphate-dependent) [Desulfovibrio sp. OttesenSCG-928-F07]|nr:phosphoglucomutase (alpha-D-glucose-1,6-bisphosphate-dependent) [Desulfovibrio sp. OttesenSCG-928-F07]